MRCLWGFEVRNKDLPRRIWRIVSLSFTTEHSGMDMALLVVICTVRLDTSPATRCRYIREIDEAKNFRCRGLSQEPIRDVRHGVSARTGGAVLHVRR